MNAEVKEVNIYIDSERTEEYLRVYTKIHLKYVIVGNVKKEQVERAIKLSQEKYCYISNMISKVTDITTEYKIKKEA